MTSSTFPEPEMPDSELRDTGGELDAAHDPAASDGPHLTASAERRVSDDLGNLTDKD
ncbi:hypothetical protein [Nakamurella deserti]|uniref:hypothetical protein n=1 Tax=Nakamurella deserti TaxID=2164074 RepID=UPI0013006CF3|nr:hypothetical protein [Nakamurella deserti]